LLRLSLGSATTVQGLGYLYGQHSLTIAMAALSLAIVAAGILLLFGMLTPIISIAAAVGSSVLAGYNLGAAQILSLAFTAETARTVLVAAALAMAGPGAYSVDALLFGRREIIIPDSPHPLDDDAA
jgi:hypothetical protein